MISRKVLRKFKERKFRSKISHKKILGKFLENSGKILGMFQKPIINNLTNN